MNGSQSVLASRQLRRYLPGLALVSITGYLLATQFILGLPVVFSLVLLLVGAFGMLVLVKPMWGFYALIATLSAEFILSVGTVFTATKLLGGIVFLSWALEAIFRRSYSLPRAPILILVPMFYSTALLSAFPAENMDMVGLRLTTLLQLGLMAFISATVLREPRQLHHVAWTILLSTFVSIAYGLASLGVGTHQALEGFALDRNRFGMIIALCIPLGFYLYPRSGKLGRVVLLALIGVFLVAEALTYSRGGFLAMMLSLALSILFVVHSHRLRFLLWISLLLVALVILMPDAYWDRMGSILPSLQGGTDTVGIRYQFWKISLRMIQDHPFLGVGAGNFMHQFARYSGIVSLRRGAAVAHNSFLGVTAEQGIPGGVLFACLFIACFVGLRRSYRQARARGHSDVADLCICFAVLLAVFVSQCMKGNYELNKYLWITFGITAALSSMSLRQRTVPAESDEEAEAPVPPEVAGTPA